MPKRSTRRAAAERGRRAWRREGRERRTVREMMVSILVCGGRSERVTGERKM